MCIRDRDFVLSEAVRLMRGEHVGSIVIVDETDEGRMPVGVLTDRDIVVSVVAKDLDARNLSVGEVMSTDLVTVREQDTIFEALRLMRSRGVRRVPVTGVGGVLVGILAVDDVLEIVAEELREIVRAIATERSREVQARH